MNLPIPVGLIGLGRHGSRYLRHLMEEDTGGQLVAISRQQREEGQRQAAQHRVKFFPDYQDLIADPAIKAILVVVPPEMHRPIALETIRHRKALLLEKPLALNSNEGRQIVEAAHTADVPLMTGHTLRYDPVIQKIQENASTLGPWKSLRGTMHLEEQPEANTGQKPGHGVLLDFGIHLLDWMCMMLPKEPLTVSAKMTRSSVDVPEARAKITLTTPSGRTCHLNIARVHTKRVTHIEVLGKTRRIRGDWTNGQIQIFEQETLISDNIVPPMSTIVHMLNDFFQTLQADQPPPITGEEGLRAVELAEACYQAAQTGQHISFPQ